METATINRLPFFTLDEIMDHPFMSKSNVSKFLLVALFGIFISSLHFVTPVDNHHLHLIYDRLCYFPVILSAFWFGFWGGALMGIMMSTLHLIHIYLDWDGDYFTNNFYQTLESSFHFIIGLVTGYLSERYLRTAKKLKQSYRELKEKTNKILNAEEQLRRTERIQALAELSAGVAHEIRTPLASIKGSAEILANQETQPEERDEFTTILLKESHHLNKIVDEFLNFARPKKSHSEICYLPKIVNDILELSMQQRRSKDIQIKINFEPDFPSIYFDPNQLKQVFVNLINNAIQAMPDGGELIISGKPINDLILCTIEDSGDGIPENVITKIYDPFFTTRSNGTGLGLSIVQKIMSQNEGYIDAKKSESGGTCFILSFSRSRSSNDE